MQQNKEYIKGVEITKPLCALFHNDKEKLIHFLEILEEDYPHEFGIIRSHHPGMANIDYIKDVMLEVNSHQEDVENSAKALEIEN